MMMMYQCENKRRKTNPIERANIFSLINFFFTWDLFRASLKKADFDEDDVYEIIKRCKSKILGDRLENEWEKELENLKNNKKPSLFQALTRIFGYEYFIIGLHQLFLRIVITTLQPILLGKFVAFFTPNQIEMTITEAYLYATGLILICFLKCFCNHNCMFYLQQLGIKARIATCSLLYRKLLKMNETNLTDMSNGVNIITLISKDVYTYDLALMFANDLWIGIIQTIIMTYIMYNAIGISAFAGVAFMIFLIPIQLLLGKLIANQRRMCASKTDERLKVLQEVFHTLKIIKMYAWEDYFVKKINLERKSEIKRLRSVYYAKSILLSLASLSIRLSFYLSALLYFYLERNFNAENVFVVLSCYFALRSVLTMGIPNGISYIAEGKISLDRISKLLLRVPRLNDFTKFDGETSVTIPHIKLINVHAETKDNVNIFRGLNLHVTSGIVMLTGQTGSGKSLLLKTIMKDVRNAKGIVNVNGTVSYASQEPWLFPGTIRQNILFGEPYDFDRYDTIIKMCALDSDIVRFPRGDNTIIVDNGSNLSRGQQARINLCRAIYKKANIYLLDDPFSSLDLHVGKFVLNQLKDYLRGKLCVLVTHQVYCFVNADRVLYLKNGLLIESDVEEMITEPVGISTVKNATERVEDAEANDMKADKVDENVKLLTKHEDVYKEQRNVGRVQYEIYKKYLESGGGIAYKIFLFIVFTLATCFGSYFDYYVKIWIEVEEDSQNFNNLTNYVHDRNMIQIYSTSLLIGTVTFSMIQSVSFFYFVTRASNILHRQCLKKIMNASMEFFDLNQIGSVLNRFAKDIGIIDEYLPNAIYEVLRIFFLLIGIIFVIIYTHYLFILYSGLIGIIIYILTIYYLPASRSLKRLDGTTRAPMIGHINASVDGLTTIRANKRQSILIKQFDQHQDLHSSASYMHMMSSRAFGFYLDLICVFYVAAIAFTFLIYYPNVIDGNVGLAITQAFGLTSIVQWAIRKLTEVENYMTSVERIVEYMTAKCEPIDGKEIVNWPHNGQIEFRNVSLRYHNDNVILNNVNFLIRSNEKVGIIGRTGAGKTSIITSLFRLYKINGEIFIDNRNIDFINLNYLRRNITIIPQDPIVFCDTVRNNLDPNNERDDDDIWKALDVVRLKDTIKDLNVTIDVNGLNFSTGQKQLICLARAILRKSKILILDEATSNVDLYTDELIQDVIKNNFINCTILIVAHRINNIIDTDKVLVLDNGCLIEYDSPKILLANQNSRFYYLAKESGVI